MARVNVGSCGCAGMYTDIKHSSFLGSWDHGPCHCQERGGSWLSLRASSLLVFLAWWCVRVHCHCRMLGIWAPGAGIGTGKGKGHADTDTWVYCNATCHMPHARCKRAVVRPASWPVASGVVCLQSPFSSLGVLLPCWMRLLGFWVWAWVVCVLFAGTGMCCVLYAASAACSMLSTAKPAAAAPPSSQ